MSEPFVAGLVLAAGGSRRLGRPKQLLPFNGATLLDHTVATARACEFDQLLVAVGGESEKVRSRVDLAGADVVVNPGFGAGCSSSIAVAMEALDPAATVLVLMLGDQPGRRARDGARAARRARRRADRRLPVRRRPRPPVRVRARGVRRPAARCTATRRCGGCSTSAPDDVEEVPVAGRVPLDVDTWADYEAVIAAAAGHA